MQNESFLPGSMQFRLELPADLPTDRTTELWVRVLPERGEKALANVPVDLRRVGPFGAVANKTPEREEWSARQATEEPAEESVVGRAEVAQPLPPLVTPPVECHEREGWTIARPDRPATAIADGVESSGEWRAASASLPVFAESVVAPVTPIDPRPMVQPAAFLEIAQAALPVAANNAAASIVTNAARKAPVWTPERGEAPSSEDSKSRSARRRTVMTPSRPAWAPER
jgi:hypothetical protein